MSDKKTKGLLHSKGIITANNVATPTSRDVANVFQSCFLNIKNKINGAIAILWGFVRIPKTNNIIASFGFESKTKISDNKIKNV
jgi:hypothetical protein